MNFTSQICTTEEQSKRLLALGLKKETADCQYAALVVDWKGNPISNPKWRFYDHNKGFIVQNFERMECIPTWSLHRLLEMTPTLVNPIRNLFVSNKSIEYQMSEGRTTLVFANENNIYDNVINCIEWLISVDEFNKEYLEK